MLVKSGRRLDEPKQCNDGRRSGVLRFKCRSAIRMRRFVWVDSLPLPWVIVGNAITLSLCDRAGQTAMQPNDIFHLTSVRLAGLPYTVTLVDIDA